MAEDQEPRRRDPHDTIRGGIGEQAMDKVLAPALEQKLKALKEKSPKSHDDLCSLWAHHTTEMRNVVLGVVWVSENILHKLGMDPGFRNVVEEGFEHLPEFMTKEMRVYTKALQFPAGYTDPPFDAVTGFKLNWELLTADGGGVNLPMDSLVNFWHLYVQQSKLGQQAREVGKQALAGVPQTVSTVRSIWRDRKAARRRGGH